MGWYTTDELQWCRKYEKFDRAYQFVQVVWLNVTNGDGDTQIRNIQW